MIRGRKILSDEIASSADIQALYGGVVPEIASRAHTDEIAKVVDRAIQKAGITKGSMLSVLHSIKGYRNMMNPVGSDIYKVEVFSFAHLFIGLC